MTQHPGELSGRETWNITKPSVVGAGGMVVSQHYLASEAGARVLADGGNAVDAAVAAGLAVGTVEPWMSGLGGCGQMVVYCARSNTASVVDFGLRAARGIDPADYPLSEGTGADLFAWPAVVGDRNVWGPGAVAVPTYLAGVAKALEVFGTWDLGRALEPAIELAERGMAVDWYATLKIAAEARKLACFAESRRVYLPEGHPPAGEWGGPPPRMRLGRLAQSLRRVAESGWEDFYRGALAQDLLEDCAEAGIVLQAEDLLACRARVIPALGVAYRDRLVYGAPGLTAGPTLGRALERLAASELDPEVPGRRAYLAYADTLSAAYRERLEKLGDDEHPREPSCTTHLSVVDAAGNAVALTQTLLSVFGSRVMLPRTGVLMNNGMMWFDPRPGRPNSMAPGKRPLTNMCPVVLCGPGGERVALGASGGRRIMPAVFQLLSFLVDYGMELEDAFNQPRIDASGTATVYADPRLPAEVVAALGESHSVQAWQHGVYPVIYACPNAAASLPATGRQVGSAFIMSPWSAAVPARDETASLTN